MLDTVGFCLTSNSSIINYCFSRAFWLFDAYHCGKDDLCEIYALQDIKLGSDLFLTKFHDTIFIEVDVDLIILVHTAIFWVFFLFDMVFL